MNEEATIESAEDTVAAAAPASGTVSINLMYLKAALLFAAKQDIRYYLNGVSLRIRDGRKAFAATTGHYLGALYMPIVDSEPQTFDIIIPRDICELVAKASAFSIKHEFEGRIEFDGDRHTLYWSAKEGVVFSPVFGLFPDYSRIIPTETSGEVSTINFRYLMQFDKAQKMLGGSPRDYPPQIKYNGQGGALIKIDSCKDFAGVVMPFRDQRS